MSRRHLFAIVVLLGAAAVAGLLALTRTITAATQASNTQIAAKSRSLDRLEASLRRSLAEQPPALPTTGQATGSSAQRTVYVRAPAAIQTPTGEREDEEDDHDRSYEQEHEDESEGADD